MSLTVTTTETPQPTKIAKMNPRIKMIKKRQGPAKSRTSHY